MELYLPESAKKVLEALDSSKTRKELLKSTGLRPRTMRYAIKKLKDRKLIIEKVKLWDLRNIVYQKAPELSEV